MEGILLRPNQAATPRIRINLHNLSLAYRLQRSLRLWTVIRHAIHPNVPLHPVTDDNRLPATRRPDVKVDNRDVLTRGRLGA